MTRPAPFSATRRTLRSSSIRFVLVCRRPAVSASTRSMSRARGPLDGVEDDRARDRRPRCRGRARRRPARPTSSSCSAAAARNVSPAAISTVRPSATLLAGDLADRRRLADAVDADEQPHVRAAGVGRLEVQRPVGAGEPALHLVAAARRAAASGVGDLLGLDPRRAGRRAARSVTPTPTSARSSASSRSSHVSSVMPAPAADAGERAGERAAGLAPSGSRSVGRLDDGVGLDDLGGSTTSRLERPPARATAVPVAGGCGGARSAAVDAAAPAAAPIGRGRPAAG